MVPSRDTMRRLAVLVVYLLVLGAKHAWGDCTTTCSTTPAGQSSNSWTSTSISSNSTLVTVTDSITSNNTTSTDFNATTNNQHNSSQTPNPTTGISVLPPLTSTGTLPSSEPPTTTTTINTTTNITATTTTNITTTNTTNTTINTSTTISSSKNCTSVIPNPLHSSATSYFHNQVLVGFLLCLVLISATVP